MFSVTAPGTLPPSRRELLRAGAIGLGSLTLADLFRQQAVASAPARNDKAIILLWVGGGPSHLETYDLKPDAPSPVRSLFRPIRTRVPGLDVCELLPRHAAIADKFTLLRSVAHDQADHGHGTRRFLTGYNDELVRGENRRSWYPSVDCNVFRQLGGYQNGMPTVTLVSNGSNVYQGPGISGSRFQPPDVQMRHAEGRYGECQGLPGMRPHPTVSLERLDNRTRLLRDLDRARARFGADARMDALPRKGDMQGFS